jgi:hypothetical protein
MASNDKISEDMFPDTAFEARHAGLGTAWGPPYLT